MELKQTIDQLANRAKARTLGTIKPADPLPAVTKSASAAATASTAAPGGGGGGIASPLTETSGARTYHAPLLLQSADGYLSFYAQPVASITMTDANGAAVVFNYAAPVTGGGGDV